MKTLNQVSVKESNVKGQHCPHKLQNKKELFEVFCERSVYRIYKILKKILKVWKNLSQRGMAVIELFFFFF